MMTKLVTPTNLRSFEPGVASVDPFASSGDSDTKHYHSDHLGTTRLMTDDAGAGVDSAVYTAFGELVTGTTNRYGYIGAHGYQAHDSDFPYLHVGARYYDPATGRFLQRDPIGIMGGLNVYVYVNNNPLAGIDPSGLCKEDAACVGFGDCCPGVKLFPGREKLSPGCKAFCDGSRIPVNCVECCADTNGDLAFMTWINPLNPFPSLNECDLWCLEEGYLE